MRTRHERRDRRRRLVLEGLEDRTLPTTFTVMNLDNAGPGSLRQAVLKANTQPGPDDVVFAAGLTGTITLRGGQLNVTDALTITGPGDNVLAVSGNRQSRVFRIDFGVRATLSGLTITEGNAGDQGGGGILSYGTLTLDGCTVTDNTAAQGGGIYNANFSALEIVNSRVTANTAADAQFGGGGGIYDDRGAVTFVASEVASNFSAGDGGGIASERGILTLQGSYVWGNAANGRGGGIYHDAQASGTLTLSQGSIVGWNTAGAGGGIYNSVGTLTVRDGSAVLANTATAEGGGIYNPGTSTTLLTDSTVAYNSALFGGGIRNTFSGRLTVERSTIAYNAASEGGGLWNSVSGQVTLTNATVSGNTAEVGGGLFTFGRATLVSCTFADNEATWGGGLWVSASMPPVSLKNSLVAGNRAWEVGADLLGRIVSQGHNLIGGTAGGSGFHATDLLDVDPLLGPLGDNGGPTPTMALLPGSPALDAGDNLDAPEFDQRSWPRVTGPAVDIGAFEVRPGPAASFYVYAPETAPAGVPIDLWVFAYDADGYLATNYSGTVAFFSTTDPDAVLPGEHTFRIEDAGWGYFPGGATFFAEGWQDLWVYDTATFAYGAAWTLVTGNGSVPSAPGGGDLGAVLAALLDGAQAEQAARKSKGG